MATLERITRQQQQQSHLSTNEFDPLNVPQAPSNLILPPQTSNTLWVAHDSQDLIDLGQEQLFSGTRSAVATVKQLPTPPLASPLSRQQSSGVATPVVSEELYRSLGAAKHAFLFALNGLVQEHLSDSHRASPAQQSAMSSTWNSIAPIRRHSVPNTSISDLNPFRQRQTATVDESSPDALLDAMVANLRVHNSSSSSHPNTTTTISHPTTEMRSLGGSSPLLPLTATTPPSSSSRKDLLMDELQARVDALSVDLAPADAELARSLASLLSCIERLLSISRVAPPSSSGTPPPPTPPPPPAAAPQQATCSSSSPPSFSQGSPNVYVTLEREAKSLQTNKEAWARGDAEQVVGAAREVEIAERELLWGRVDDLSERVGELCRERARRAALELELELELEERDGVVMMMEGEGEETEEIDEKRMEAERERDDSSSMDGHDLPRYSHDFGTSLPPAYGNAHGQQQHSPADWEKPPISPQLAFLSSAVPASPLEASLASSTPTATTTTTRTRPRRISNVHSEKMLRDLESVSMAIERLYVVSPQLANQRVEPDRRLVRERQLAKLGNAIERLSKGRLDDQRAAPSPVIPEEPEQKAARIKKIQDVALDKLIDQIDRAASRTLTDQRVDLNAFNSKRRERSMVDPSHRLSLPDPSEKERREYILEHTGKGRLASQDATFHTGYAERFPRPPSPGAPVTITEFFRAEAASSQNEDMRPRSNSFPTRPTLKKRFSSKGLFRSDEDQANGANAVASGSGLGSKKSSTLRLGVGVFKKGSTPTSMSRRGSLDSRVEPTGLGLSGSGMSRSGSCGLDIHAISPLDFVAEESRNLGTIVVTFWPRHPTATREEYEVLSVDSDSILIAPASGGTASCLPLPSSVISQAVTVVPAGDFFEAKLVTIPPSPTRLRPDLEVHAPLATAELRDSLPSSFACAKCHAQLVDSSQITRYSALPSEHWAELLDAWMCHQDQTLSEDLVAKGKGIKPRLDEGLVASSYILFSREITRNWITPEKSELTRTASDDVLLPAHCATCNTLIGQHVQSLSQDSVQTCVRLLKYATYPTGSTLAALPRYNLATHITSELLEIGQAHACHRFVLQDLEDEQPRLLLWLFNPAVRLSFSSASHTAGILLDEKSSSPLQSIAALLSANGANEPRPVGRTMNVVKIFYLVVGDGRNGGGNAYREFTDSPHSTPEVMIYPSEVIRRLTDLLKASTSIFPVDKRKWGEMDAGFLERL
ncbi:hypothetical protein T439DRAFT_324129 [Meredithblackwellia eburnea MCA 4105]